MNKKLLLLCDSAYSTVAKEIALSMKCFEKVDILNQYYGTSEAESKYHEASIGNLDDYEKFAGTYDYAIAVFEDPQVRLTWSDKLIEAGFAIPSLISPKAHVSPSAQINQGCIIEPLVGISSNVSVGSCSIIKMGALINHGCVISKGCCCDNYSIIKTGAYIEPYRVVEMRRTIESYEETLRIRQAYN